ncbi:MAG: tetratricopeptide repeat protein [Candidatus Promineifilaceae bacterium]
MSRQPLKTRQFIEILRKALKNYDDPLWLGTHSPLASPYFLGEYLQNSAENDTPHGRGTILQHLLYDTASKLWGSPLPKTRKQLVDQVELERASKGSKGNAYAFYILELRYFRRYFSTYTQPLGSKKIADYLAVADANFFKHLTKAVERLTVEMLKQVRPTFRLEQPAVSSVIVGRHTQARLITQYLGTTQAVMISGMSGIGKTSLGTSIYSDWQSTPKFWYTIRPYLNDQLNSILFALAHFLNQHGASTLWSQLLIEAEKPQKTGALLGYLEHDLKKVQPLLCFDEVDRLAVLHSPENNPNHTAIVELLEMLIPLTPVLFMGQFPILDTPHHYALTGLILDESAQLLQQIAPDVRIEAVSQWHQWTHGNPRLLLLCAMLHHNGESIGVETFNLSGPFQRLWRRLSVPEKQILAALSVYRSPAPADVWQSKLLVLTTLIQRQLVVKDEQGGVEMLPAWRRYLYQHILLQEMREDGHEQAAAVRLERGEYTAAVYHYAKAGETTQALEIWYTHRDFEIERGFAAVARDIFINLSAKHIPATHKKKLWIVRSQLFIATGDFDAVLTTPRPQDDEQGETLEDVFIDENLAFVQYLRADSTQALEQSETALGRLTRLSAYEAGGHAQRGRIFLDERQLQASYREADAIYYVYQRLQAQIAGRSGKFAEAEVAFSEMLKSAEISPQQRTRLHHDLAVIYGQQGKIKRAKYHAQQAMQFCREIGDRVLQETVQLVLVGIYLQAGKFAEVIQYGEPTLQFFREIKYNVVLSSLLNYLAEAYFELDDIEKARQYAYEAYKMENISELPNTCYTLGRIHVLDKAYAFARVVFNYGISICEQQDNIFLLAYLLRERAKLSYLEEKTAEAEADRKAATDLFVRMGLNNEIKVTQAL